MTTTINSTYEYTLYSTTTEHPITRLSNQLSNWFVPILVPLVLINNALVLHLLAPRFKCSFSRTFVSVRGYCCASRKARVRLRGPSTVQLYYVLLASADLASLVPNVYILIGKPLIKGSKSQLTK